LIHAFALLADIIRSVKNTEAKYNFKRIKISLMAVVALVVLAGILQLVLAMIPPNDGDGEYDENSAEVAHGADPKRETKPSGENSVTAESEVRNDKGSDKHGAAIDDNDAASSKTSDDKIRASRADLLKGLVLDGDSISSDKAGDIAAEERDFAKHVEFIDQREILPAGCEIVALTVTLRSMGHGLEPQDLADNYVTMNGELPESYSGSPYANGGGLPPCIADAGNAWLSEHSKGYRAYDTTGSTLDALIALVEEGYPILMWATEGMIMPSDIREFGSYIWYWPLHCVVVYGTDGDSIKICDSLAGMIECERKKLGDIYAACGSMSVAVLPV